MTIATRTRAFARIRRLRAGAVMAATSPPAVLKRASSSVSRMTSSM